MTYRLLRDEEHRVFYFLSEDRPFHVTLPADRISFETKSFIFDLDRMRLKTDHTKLVWKMLSEIRRKSDKTVYDQAAREIRIQEYLGFDAPTLLVMHAGYPCEVCETENATRFQAWSMSTIELLGKLHR